MQGWDGGVEGVDAVFDPGDFFGVEATGLAQLCERGVGGEVGAYDKEFVLYEEEQGVVVGVVAHLTQYTDVGVEFVDGSVGFETGVVFGNALAAHQRGGPFVSGHCIEVAFFHKVELIVWEINGYTGQEVRNKFERRIRCGKGWVCRTAGSVVRAGGRFVVRVSRRCLVYCR